AMKVESDSPSPNRGRYRGGSRQSPIQVEIDWFLDDLSKDEIDLAQMRQQLVSWLGDLPDEESRLAFIRDLKESLKSFAPSEKANACYAFARVRFPKIERELSRRKDVSGIQGPL